MANTQFDTLAVHVGSEPDPQTGAVINPLSLSTTYAQTSAAQPVGEYEYSRSDNPNRRQFEQVCAALEQGKHALAYSSGSAATANIIQSLAGGGAHILSFADVYGGTHRYFTKVAQLHGNEVTLAHDLHVNIKNLLRDSTRLVWVETPSNPTLSITDIAAIASAVNERRNKTGQQLLLVVDNTFMSPYIQNPLVLGADVVLHSVTKYINGHSDVVMGLVVVRDDSVHERLRFMQNAIGAVPSPFDCWLAHRGVKTLALRMRASAHSAQKIAELLHSRIGKDIEAVNFPGLPSHPGYDVVQRQHRDGLGGGMISFRVKGGAEQASKFCAATKIFTLAESLGGIESLCEVPAAMTHSGIPVAEREASGVFDNLVRLSVGIEATEDLITDVLSALEASQQ